jgi:hypothetical protein
MELVEEWNAEKQFGNPTISILLIIGIVFVAVESIALYNLKRHGTNGILFCFMALRVVVWVNSHNLKVLEA